MMRPSRSTPTTTHTAIMMVFLWCIAEPDDGAGAADGEDVAAAFGAAVFAAEDEEEVGVAVAEVDDDVGELVDSAARLELSWLNADAAAPMKLLRGLVSVDCPIAPLAPTKANAADRRSWRCIVAYEENMREMQRIS